jgi:hypothetical protein
VDSYLLQDWVTLRADTSIGATDIPQPAGLWLDLGPASDVTFFLDVSAKTGTSGRMRYETSPTRDASQFQTLSQFSLAANISTSPQVLRFALYDNPSVPLARWVRWRVLNDVGVGVWDVTFRITVMAYPR